MFDRKKWLKDNQEKIKAYHRKNGPKYWSIQNARKLRFKPAGKQILLKEKVRKGICQKCGAIKGINCKVTNIHHYSKYHKDDPLKDTIELCASCHVKEEWKLGSYANRTKK